jgi:hypothetical protein
MVASSFAQATSTLTVLEFEMDIVKKARREIGKNYLDRTKNVIVLRMNLQAGFETDANNDGSASSLSSPARGRNLTAQAAGAIILTNTYSNPGENSRTSPSTDAELLQAPPHG